MLPRPPETGKMYDEAQWLPRTTAPPGSDASTAVMSKRSRVGKIYVDYLRK